MATAHPRPVARRHVHEQVKAVRSRKVPIILIGGWIFILPLLTIGVTKLLNSSKSSDHARTHVNAPAADRAAFDVRSLNRSAAWIRQDVMVPAARAAKALTAKQNKLILAEGKQDIIDTVKAKLSPHLGKTVRWALTVGSVTEKTVTVSWQDSYSSSQDEGPIHIMWPGWNTWQNRGHFSIGTSISVEHARQLHPGAHLVVEGTVEDFTLPNIFNSYARATQPLTIKLVNVTVVAP